ncbi:hypothetical protein [Butyrivibrio sp. WCE2006]|uniref:hypothetical protein n=1 Tax=Butyrivibrio sp. WCE2006 TaxID=1410611 RepID=UPI001A9A69D8
MILLIMYPYKKTIIGGVTWDEFILGHAVRTYARFGIGQFMEYLKAFTFLLNAFIFFICLESLNVEKLILLISKIFKGFILYGVIEAIVNNFLKISLFGRITSKITGTSGYELSQVYLRNGLNCLQGLTKEPSHYVNALFFTYLILLCEKKIHGQKRIWFATIIVLLLLSRAYSSVYIIVTIMFIHYMLEWIKEQKKAILYRIRWVGIFFTIMIGILISFRFMKGNYFLWRTTILLKSLGRILYGNWHSLRYIGSSQIRIISIMESLPILCDRFLIGIGLGTAHLHSAFIMSLISVGAFGFLSWLAFLFGASSFANKKIRLIIISSLVLVNIFGSMGNKMLYTSSNFIYLLFGFVYSRENYYFEIRELCNEEIACSNRC